MKVVSIIYRALRRVLIELTSYWERIHFAIQLRVNDVMHGGGHTVKGPSRIHVSRSGSFTLGKGMRLNSGASYNRIGRQAMSQFMVHDTGRLSIGDDLAMSSSTIVCTAHIKIGDRVMIGGNVVIYDTDFHSLDHRHRVDTELDMTHRSAAEVIIGNDVFIGAHSTILKGVRIGSGAVIGACSVVTRDIPAGEVWAGNPAKCIRRAEFKNEIRVA